MGRLYKINPTCPYCGEEHEYWTIRLTDEGQHTLFINRMIGVIS